MATARAKQIAGVLLVAGIAIPAASHAAHERDAQLRAARDLDVLRAALGEEKLDYLGKSYGTLLGLTYAETFPDSSVTAVHRAPGDFSSGKQGDVLTVEFTVMGISCIGLNGGPEFKHTEAFSFQVTTDDQAETDRYWNAIVGNGGEESACGWCKDRWGLSWQITPLALTKAISDPDPAAAKRAFDAMMEMKSLCISMLGFA